MAWFERIFGSLTGGIPGKPDNDVVKQAAASASLPPERIGIAGEYDESGLAKRVTLAFDEDPELKDIGSLWVSQKGGTVVLKGKVPSPGFLAFGKRALACLLSHSANPPTRDETKTRSLERN